MFRKIRKSLGRKSMVFAVVLVFGMVLSACGSGAGESVVSDGLLSDDVPSGKEQVLSGEKEVVTISEVPEMQKDTELLEGSSGLVDGEQNQKDTGPLEGNLGLVDDEQSEPEKSGNTPTKGTKAQEDSGVSNDEPKPMQEGQGQFGEGQAEKEQEQQKEEQSEEQVQTWQSAYLEVIYHLWDYLAPRYEPLSYEDSRREYDNPMDIGIFYFGLHDFDSDGTLELITGDGKGLAVFTYKEGSVEKIADLCEPDLSRIWCVCGVSFKDNSIRVECDGSGGANVVNFGYQEGKYVLGHYNEQTPTDPITINGREATMEEIEKIYTTDYGKIEEEETRERFRLINENGTWILKATWWSDEESVLDMNFDFDSVVW